MSREKNLVKNTIILSFGTILPKLVAIITLPLLTGYLTKAEYGTYDLITTLVSLLLPAVTLQIQSAAFRFLIKVRNDKKEANIIISNVFFFTTFVSVLSLIVLYFVLYKFTFITRLAIVIYFFLDIMLISLRQIARGIGDNMGFALNAIIHSISMLLFTFLVLIIFKIGLNGVLLALILSTLLSLIVLAIKTKIFKSININCYSKQKIKEMIKYSWPMVPNNLSNWVLNLSDRLVITSFIGIEANAVYAVANKIPNLLRTFQATFTNAWQENASLSVNDLDTEEYYSKMFDSIFCILVSLTCFLIASSPILFHFLIKGNYSEAYYQMPILYIGVFCSCISSFIGGIYIAHMKTKSVGITTIFAALCNLLIDLLFVKKIGIYAGSISTSVSYFILSIFRMHDIKKFQKIKYDYKKIVLSILIIIVLSIFSYQRNVYLNILIMFISIFVTILLNKSILQIMMKKIRKKVKNVKKSDKKNHIKRKI